MTIIRGGGGIVLGDPAVTNHNITTHPETWFHFPGTNDWNDQLGNLSPLSIIGDGSDLFSFGSTEDSLEWQQGDGSKTFATREGPAGEFTYAAPGTVGLGGPFTIACLYRFPKNISAHSTATLFGVFYASSSFAIRLEVNTSEWMEGEWGSSPVSVASSNVRGRDGLVNTTNWHHACVTADGTNGGTDYTIRLYMDGLDVSGTSPPINRADVNSTIENMFVRVGAQTTTGAKFYGQMRSFIGIRKALSPTEVAALSTATIGRVGFPT